MKIYARKSVMKDVEADEMFKVTQAGIKFYEDLFGKPFSFTKYD